MLLSGLEPLTSSRVRSMASTGLSAGCRYGAHWPPAQVLRTVIRISYSLHRSVCSLTRPTSTNGASGRCWVRTSVLLVSSTSPITFC